MEQGKRQIVHFDLDSFFVSVERLKNSELQGLPVIIGGTSDRGVVSSCSYEARAFGVHAGMPMKMARHLCSQAVYIRGDMDSYSKYSRMVTEVIAGKAPIYEKASIDEHYLDITGMDRFFGSLQWTRELRTQIIKETGLPISFGLSINKTISKMATSEAKPNGSLEIPGNAVKPFLFPLSIRKIPMLGAQTYRLLRSMGIITIETLSMIPPEMLEKVLGKNGIVLWKKANGIDHTPVEPYTERKSISTEHTFERDSIDVKMLKRRLSGMIEKICFELRKQGKLTSCITVKIRYSNFDTHSMQKRISYTSFDHQLIEMGQELFDKLYKRRMLVRLIGVRFSHLVNGVQQLNLFEDNSENVRLYLAMDRLRKKYGSKIVQRAVSMKETADHDQQKQEYEGLLQVVRPDKSWLLKKHF